MFIVLLIFRHEHQVKRSCAAGGLQCPQNQAGYI